MGRGPTPTTGMGSRTGTTAPFKSKGGTGTGPPNSGGIKGNAGETAYHGGRNSPLWAERHGATSQSNLVAPMMVTQEPSFLSTMPHAQAENSYMSLPQLTADVSRSSTLFAMVADGSLVSKPKRSEVESTFLSDSRGHGASNAFPVPDLKLLYRSPVSFMSAQRTAPPTRDRLAKPCATSPASRLTPHQLKQPLQVLLASHRGGARAQHPTDLAESVAGNTGYNLGAPGNPPYLDVYVALRVRRRCRLTHQVDTSG